MKTLPIILFSIFLLWSCDDDNDPISEPPKVDFTIYSPLINVDCNVKIANNNDTNSIKRYEWDFGDEHQFITNAFNIPQHSYTNPGDYNIKLIVVKDDLSKDSLTQQIRVGEIFVTQLELARISEYKNTDEILRWDNEDTGQDIFPDIQIQLFEEGEIIYKSDIISNISRSNIPLTLSVPEIKIKSIGKGNMSYLGNWQLQKLLLIDSDTDTDEIMFATDKCAILGSTSEGYDYDSHTGSFSVFCGEYEIITHYIVK